MSDNITGTNSLDGEGQENNIVNESVNNDLNDNDNNNNLDSQGYDSDPDAAPSKTSDDVTGESEESTSQNNPSPSANDAEDQTEGDEDSDNDDSNNLEKMILSTGIRVGTPIKTKYMSYFITRANPEGLYILDISKTLARIDVAAKFIGRSNIANVAVTSAREYGKTPIEKFCELTGARGIFGRFMPGTFTNPSLPKYLEPEIVIVTDPQADEQAVIEATRAGVPVIALSNSDNITSKVDLVIPSNNRGRKALATVYWLLTKEVLKKQGKIKSDSEMPLSIDDFEAKLVEEII
jgi:small subunit ribosomal protein S2